MGGYGVCGAGGGCWWSFTVPGRACEPGQVRCGMQPQLSPMMQPPPPAGCTGSAPPGAGGGFGAGTDTIGAVAAIAAALPKDSPTASTSAAAPPHSAATSLSRLVMIPNVGPRRPMRRSRGQSLSRSMEYTADNYGYAFRPPARGAPSGCSAPESISSAQWTRRDGRPSRLGDRILREAGQYDVVAPRAHLACVGSAQPWHSRCAVLPAGAIRTRSAAGHTDGAARVDALATTQ